MVKRVVIALGGLAIGLMFVYLFSSDVRDTIEILRERADSKKWTTQERIEALKPVLEPLWVERFKAAGVSFPPASSALVIYKAERRMEIYSGSEKQKKLIHVFEVRSRSGEIGPKLREGDRQVPEGIYKIESLNPSSVFHLSLKLDYPSPQDIADAQAEDRRDPLGGDIMIHGGRFSKGCVAIGNRAIEELFYLVATTVPLYNWQVVIVPHDLLTTPPPAEVVAKHSWMQDRYEQLKKKLIVLRTGQVQ